MPRSFDPSSPELMDRPQPVSEVLRRDLANLEGLNRHFGAHRIARRFLAPHLLPDHHIRILDLCTASGDIPRLAVNLARTSGCHIHIDAVDFQSSTLEIASELSAGYPEISYHAADALLWQPPTPPDLVLCSLALHHFSEPDAISLLARCRSLARRATLVADLRRSPITTLGVYAVTALFYRDPMTVADGRESARRAFSFTEFAALARRAGWDHFSHKKRPFGRQEIVWSAPHPGSHPCHHPTL